MSDVKELEYYRTLIRMLPGTQRAELTWTLFMALLRRLIAMHKRIGDLEARISKLEATQEKQHD